MTAWREPRGVAGRAVAVAKADERAARVLPIAQALQAEGRSLKQVAAALNEQNVPAARGGKWTPGGVSKLLRKGRSQQAENRT
jgi:hypothetical protein